MEIVVDVPDPNFAMVIAAMVLTLQNKRVLVFNMKAFNYYSLLDR